jgi:hypothetical protein
MAKFFVVHAHEPIQMGLRTYRFGLTEEGLDDPKSDVVALELNVDRHFTYDMEWRGERYRLEYVSSLTTMDSEIRIYQGLKVG